MVTRAFIAIFALAILFTTFSNIPKPELISFRKILTPIKEKVENKPKKITLHIKIWLKPEKVEFSENKNNYFIIGTAKEKNKEIRYIIQKKLNKKEISGIFKGKKRAIYIQKSYISQITIKGVLYKHIMLCEKFERKKRK